MTGVDGVRSAAKGILIDGDRVLLSRCRDKYNGDYWCLPGGGQEKYETLHETLVREMLEETGYTVVPGRFAALYEEICDDEGYRAAYPQYSHKMYHIFLCSLVPVVRHEPTEPDDSQLDCEWIPFEQLPGLKILPPALGRSLTHLLREDVPLYLGSEHIPLPHG